MRILGIFLFFAITAQNYAQVAGTVKNQVGNPIKNALVCLKNNPSVFDKTDEAGNFKLSSGSSNASLRIGALGYNTIKSTTKRRIVLQKDDLLNTDVYHISFDHLREGKRYTKDEIKADFYTASGAGFYDGKEENDRASVDYKVSRDPGGVSLKVRFPKGELKTANSGVDTRIPLANTFKNNTFEAEDLYVSYWIKFSDNFDFSLCGGKLPSLGGSVAGTRDQNRWKGRIMWRKGGSIQFYMELPDNRFNAEDERFWGQKIKEGSNICTYEYENFLRSPGWHNIELHYRFETPGQSNGVFEGWIDGKNLSSMNATVFNNYRPKGTSRENITINYLLLSAFLGGSSEAYEPNEDIYAWFDEFRVSKTRINEFSRYDNTLAVNTVTNSGVAFYPNPSKDLFYLEKTTVYKVFDILGNQITSGTGKQINLAGKSSGIYFLQTKENQQLTKMIKL